MGRCREQCGLPATPGWAAGGETGGLPGERLLRVLAGSLARCLPGHVCPLPSPFPSPRVRGKLDGGICGRSRAVALRLWDREGRCQAGQSHLHAKPGNGK